MDSEGIDFDSLTHSAMYSSVEAQFDARMDRARMEKGDTNQARGRSATRGKNHRKKKRDIDESDRFAEDELPSSVCHMTASRKRRQITGDFTLTQQGDSVAYAATRLSKADALELGTDFGSMEVALLVERPYSYKSTVYGDINIEPGSTVTLRRKGHRKSSREDRKSSREDRKSSGEDRKSSGEDGKLKKSVTTTVKVFDSIRRYDSQRVADVAVIVCTWVDGFFGE